MVPVLCKPFTWDAPTPMSSHERFRITSFVLTTERAASIVLFTTEGKPFQNPLVTVNITNALTHKDQLTVHCKSADDDLGVHQLHPLGGYAFTFRPNFIGTTLFYCTFQWPGWSYNFDIYKDSRDRDRCNDLCLWIVGEQGVCMFHYVTKKYDFCYTWVDK
uniref:S-protein homolog n=1 Tax=Cucumis melo TaxID=3656 RepID=A0A9I9DW00_CUCME